MSRAPKARTCFICGRPTLLPGYDIHVGKCRELFIQREMQKPAKERRACPRDPYSSTGGRGFQSLEEQNEVISQAWKETLAQCQNCGRSFLPEKLAIHQRSCTSSNPARSISGAVRSSAASGATMRGSTTAVSYGPDTTFTSSSASAKRTGGMGVGGGGLRGSTKNSYGSGEYDNDYGYEESAFDNRSLSGTNRSTALGGTKGGLDQYRETPEYGHLLKCRDCGRNFNPDSYDKHVKICRKVFQSKRKPFDSAKHRAEGTELAAYYDGRRRKGPAGSASAATTARATAMLSSLNNSASNAAAAGRSRTSRAGGGDGGGSKWRQESSAFRAAMKQAKLVSQAEKRSKETGIPLHVLLPANSGRGGAGYGGGGGGGYGEVDPSYLQCPHCGRSFNQKAGERHIPQCKNIINKPSRLSRHSGAPSYSTNTPSAATVSSHTPAGFGSNSARRFSGGIVSAGGAGTERGGGGFGGGGFGGGGFGQSTRESALNNRAIMDPRGRGGGVSVGGWGDDSGNTMQAMSSKTHSMSDPVRMNNNSSTNNAGSMGYGGGRSRMSAAESNYPSTTSSSSAAAARRGSFGPAATDNNGSSKGYSYDMGGSSSSANNRGTINSNYSDPRGSRANNSTSRPRGGRF